MTLLHIYFALRKQQSFHRLLNPSPGKQAAASTSSGKSWKRATALSSGIALEINAFDALGRTVLHLACASTEPSSLEYVRMLLAHPAINVNILDKESHWTPLHRALYVGNVSAAILLLKRSDTDTSIKDFEGYTAYDLYNSTVRSAQPTADEDALAELFTWGANRNAALGLGDGNDRAYPDQVVIPSKDDSARQHNKTLDERFVPVQVRQVSMSKLHTVVVTSELRDNIRVCGFGSGGRLGSSQHTQYGLIPLPEMKHTIESVALGQDHTLALTSTGEVLSWGLNRFSQLGYVMEVSSGGRHDEPIQASPRKVGSLRKEFVKGVAACKTSSACWTNTEVWTWGTNGGQLGYDKALTPVQVLPRKVSSIVKPVCAIEIIETLMACLLVTGEVLCVWSGGVSKISFPTQRFPSEISVYRPPQAVKGPIIAKLASCDDTIAALSSNGEVFTFTSQPDGGDSLKSSSAFKPQRVWALRRQFSAVQDVDIGADGTVIVCTQSGHVYIRSRSTKGGQGSGIKAFKFQRIPYIQRTVAVCANSTGAFGALRVDFKPLPIRLTVRSFSADIAEMQPYLALSMSAGSSLTMSNSMIPLLDADEDAEDASIMDDIRDFSKLLHVLDQRKDVPDIALPYNADVIILTSGPLRFPAHRLILALRCPVLGNVLHNGCSLKLSGIEVSLISDGSISKVQIKGCHPLTVLIVLRYLYSDQLLAIWDFRIGNPFASQFETFDFTPTIIKAELQSLARILDLQLLLRALQSPGKRVPTPSQAEDFRLLYEKTQITGLSRRNANEDPLAPDVALHFADQVVYCHSVVLQARSPFFTSFYGDGVWTFKRRDKSGIIDVDLKHLEWQVMRYIVRWMCYGDENLFESLDFVQEIDDVLSFIFSVLSAANELLLDRLILICSQVILKYLNAYNACYLLTDATHFNAVQLVERIQSFIAANLEMMLEDRMLEDLDPWIVRQLAEYICGAQMTKSFVSRSNSLANEALQKHAEWLALQDIPVVLEPVGRSHIHRDSPKLSPPGPTKPHRIAGLSSPAGPVTRNVADSGQSGDELFAMDEVLTPDRPVPAVAEPSVPGAVWKRPPSTPTIDLKSIMAEAENTRVGAASRPVQNRPSQESLIRAAAPQRMTTGSSLKANVSPTPRRMSSDIDLGETFSLPPPVAAAASKPTSVRTPQRPPPQSGPSSSPKPGLGPIFSPIRQAPQTSSSSATRRVSNTGAAWTLPPVQPVVQSSAAPSSLSFAEIQQSQLLQGKPTPKDKRSLVEIQEEEQAMQLEVDFIKWWTAEEARIQEEARQAPEVPSASPSRRRNQGGKKPHSNIRSKAGQATPAGGSGKGGRGGKSSQSTVAGETPPAGGSSIGANTNVVPSSDGQRSRNRPRTRR